MNIAKIPSSFDRSIHRSLHRSLDQPGRAQSDAPAAGVGALPVGAAVRLRGEPQRRHRLVPLSLRQRRGPASALRAVAPPAPRDRDLPVGGGAADGGVFHDLKRGAIVGACNGEEEEERKEEEEEEEKER